MKRFDSSSLGSFPLSIELVEHSLDNDESPASAVRKVSNKKKLEGKEYAASKLAEVLRQRKLKSGHAKYWDQLAVDIVSMEENDDTETWSYDKVVVRCMVCGRKHDGATINVPNFAKSHFDEVDGVARCKTCAKQGGLSSRVAICSLDQQRAQMQAKIGLQKKLLCGEPHDWIEHLALHMSCIVPPHRPHPSATSQSWAH
jgi:hypothetical protein